MQGWLSAIGACLLSFLTILSGCQYVRPTLNAPLKQWDPQYGYRFSNLAPPEEGNTDSLFFLAAFSGGGTRASALAFGALRELARQRIRWEGKDKRLLDELDLIYALSGGTFTGASYALFGDRIFQDSNPASSARIGTANSEDGFSDRRATGSGSGRPTMVAPTSWRIF